MHQLKMTPRAERDIASAYQWYAARGKTLGERLDAAVTRTINEIVDHPFRYSEMDPGVRRSLVDGFPYKVIYRVNNDTIEILAIYHTARDPDRWDDPNRD